MHRQVQIINDSIFSKYDNETVVGSLNYFNDHILYVSNSVARTWDEMPREFKMKIYDKKYFLNTELFDRPHYTLPLIRYGIYEKNGKKVCLIGAIQSKKDNTSKEVTSIFNRTRFKVNKDVPIDENVTDVEPAHLIALSIFINFLHIESITEIEVPCLYVLDYQYHQIDNIKLMEEFQIEWTENKKQRFPERFLQAKQLLEKALNKEDMISKNKR